jgi:hypothetical protein
MTEAQEAVRQRRNKTMGQEVVGREVTGNEETMQLRMDGL